MTRDWTRRAWLWHTAAGGATWWLSRAARAQAPDEAGSPSMRRFIGVYMPHGMAVELWRPGEDFELRGPERILAPFDDPDTYGCSFRDRLLVLEGLDLAAGIEVGTIGHDAARVILTGSGADGRTPSLDHYLAQDCQLGADTPLTTLALGVGISGAKIGECISYAGDGTPLPSLIDPAATYAELFGTPLTDTSAEAQAAARARGKSALDALRGDLERLRRAAPAAERLKLEQHHHALREVEKRLAVVERRCTPPAPPSAVPRVHAFGGGEPFFEAITNLQSELLACAFACDLTRFATLFLADLSRTGLDPSLPVDIHNDVAHRYVAQRDNHPGDPETWLPLARQNRHSVAQLVRLLVRLQEKGVLDETLVLASSDMGDPASHSSRDVPTLVIGNGAFRGGRHLRLKESEPLTETGLLPNNRLLVSVAEAFGVAMERFGHAHDPSIVTGRLRSLS